MGAGLSGNPSYVSDGRLNDWDFPPVILGELEFILRALAQRQARSLSQAV